ASTRGCRHGDGRPTRRLGGASGGAGSRPDRAGRGGSGLLAARTGRLPRLGRRRAGDRPAAGIAGELRQGHPRCSGQAGPANHHHRLGPPGLRLRRPDRAAETGRRRRRARRRRGAGPGRHLCPGGRQSPRLPADRCGARPRLPPAAGPGRPAAGRAAGPRRSGGG
ncbi:MAG: hypothetical protein AVDCRST_MAG61-699, partial [uncultured Friedmanniella sp.]